STSSTTNSSSSLHLLQMYGAAGSSLYNEQRRVTFEVLAAALLSRHCEIVKVNMAKQKHVVRQGTTEGGAPMSQGLEDVDLLADMKGNIEEVEGRSRRDVSLNQYEDVDEEQRAEDDDVETSSVAADDFQSPPVSDKEDADDGTTSASGAPTPSSTSMLSTAEGGEASSSTASAGQT
ncbi:unnamed protein product, partial [Amoebophrya sp. A25]